jgi:hypothetical protein
MRDFELTNEELDIVSGGADTLFGAFVEGFNKGKSEPLPPPPPAAPSPTGGVHGYNWIEVYS